MPAHFACAAVPPDHWLPLLRDFSTWLVSHLPSASGESSVLLSGAHHVPTAFAVVGTPPLAGPEGLDGIHHHVRIDGGTEPAFHKGLDGIHHHVMIDGGTEPAFHNAFWNEHRNGTYVDFLTHEPLFSSVSKFDSGTGWPSFTQSINAGAVEFSLPSASGVMEVHTTNGGHHLGHVFPGEGPLGQDRYCINSAALSFQPQNSPHIAESTSLLSLGQHTDGQNLATEVHTIGLAGGCYWGLQDVIDSIPGVVDSHVGFMGGPPSEHPTYDSLEQLNAHHPARPWVETVEVSYEDRPGTLDHILQAFSNFRDSVNYGLRYSREVFGNEEQLTALPQAAGATVMPAAQTRFQISDRPFDQHYSSHGLSHLGSGVYRVR